MSSPPGRIELPPDDDELVAEDDSVIGRAFRVSLIAFALVGAGIATAMWVLQRPPKLPPPTNSVVAPPVSFQTPDKPPDVRFTDITRSAGIDFVHVNGAYGEKLLPETMGGGCAFLDYDNDGDQDILLVNSTYWPDHVPQDVRPPTMGLYRNDGKGHFENVTAGSGLDFSAYGMGVAVGDYDNDGWVDVYITAVGPNNLLRNKSGKFEDVTAKAGVAGAQDAWSTAAGFLDYDNDGDLDLFVCNYVRWSRDIDIQVDYRLEGVGRAYGPPTNFEGTQPYFFRNDGNGTFSEVAEKIGLYVKNAATGLPVAKSLGLAPVDVDNDGWLDVIVANDTTRKFLFRNKRDPGAPGFEEVGTAYGVAYDRTGAATGAMGIDAGRYRNDDTLGIFIGNFANEMTSLYVSQGRPDLFLDEAITEGIGNPTRLVLTFGLFLFDFDLDGRLDLLQANGHIEDRINVTQPSQHFEQPAQLFWSCGPKARGCFAEVPQVQIGDLAKPLVGRGAAYADIDGDGDLDVLITQIARPPLLLRNDQQTEHHWIRMKLAGTKCNRDTVGARLEAKVAGAVLRRQIMPTRSYLSQVELPVTLGLGAARQIDELTITWPGGEIERLNALSVDRSYLIEQGKGIIER